MNDCQYCHDNPTWGPAGETCVLCGQPFVAVSGPLRQLLVDGKPTAVYMDDVNIYGGGGLLGEHDDEEAKR